jgi:sulfite reductase (NADPH) flavoprotein alpha-component
VIRADTGELLGAISVPVDCVAVERRRICVSHSGLPVMQRPFKRILFRLHWICGIAAGLVLAVVGVTGAILGFEAELIRFMNPELRIEGEHGAPKPLSSLVEAVKAAQPDYRVRGVAWEGDDAALIVRMSRGAERGALQIAVDPYSGAVLGAPRGAGFFETVEQLHRNLAAGPVGRQVVGASTAILIVLAISGIVLRWPRRASSVRSWLTFNVKLRGRPFMWHLHSVSATWLLAFYLIAALTGLWWSYDFYRDAVNRIAGVTSPMRRPGASPDARADIPPAAIDAAWTTFRHEAPDASRATLALAGDADAPIEIRYLTPASAHNRAWNTLKIDAKNGQSVGDELYAELPRGRRFVSSLFPLHSGDFFGWPGRIAMAIAALLMPFFFVTGIWMWVQRRAAAKARAGQAARSDAVDRIQRPALDT